jgi:hypothetical protein
VDATKTNRPEADLGRMVMGKVGRLEVMGKSSGYEFVVWKRRAQCQGTQLYTTWKQTSSGGSKIKLTFCI